MKDRIKRFNIPLYRIGYKPYCTLLCTQRMAKKLVKELSRYRNTVIDLVEKYPDEFYSEKWSLAYPNGEQTPFYGVCKEEDIEKKIRSAKNLAIDFSVVPYAYELKKEENIYSDELKDLISSDLEDEVQND